MQYCAGGPGPSFFGQFGDAPSNGPEDSAYAALEHWMEKGIAPSHLIATKYVDDNPAQGISMTRLLCAYPQVAKYRAPVTGTMPPVSYARQEAGDCADLQDLYVDVGDKTLSSPPCEKVFCPGSP
jgi:hypothetical protein